MPKFDWTIDESASWPPRRRPRPPFGVTAIEVMRSCPLRSCFESSEGYERRTGFAARVGTAFHKTLEYLSAHPPTGSLREAAEDACERFLSELEAQEAAALARPRERTLPREERRTDRAIEAVIEEARRFGNFPEGSNAFSLKVRTQRPLLAVPFPDVARSSSSGCASGDDRSNLQ